MGGSRIKRSVGPLADRARADPSAFLDATMAASASHAGAFVYAALTVQLGWLLELLERQEVRGCSCGGAELGVGAVR